ncbi:MAG: hypothetical protein LBJ67_11460 [Planctomycetaceae bacterium]|jgi:hypothetical protein|nr:hypothetical protein [Planctomycetaceae bacterium]
MAKKRQVRNLFPFYCVNFNDYGMVDRSVVKRIPTVPQPKTPKGQEMKKRHFSQVVRRTLLIAAFVGVFAGWSVFSNVSAQAQSVPKSEEWKTVGVVSLTSTDAGLPILQRCADAAGHGKLMSQFAGSQKEAFGTLDFSKPKGIIWQTNGKSFQWFAFFAVKDITKLPYGIGDMIAGAEKNESGWYKVRCPHSQELTQHGVPAMFQTLYIKYENGWAYASLGPRLPKTLPADPTVLLEGLDKEYPVAFRLNSAAVPQSLLKGYAMLFKQLFPMLKMFVLPAFQQQSAPEHMQKLMSAYMTAYFDLLDTLIAEMTEQIVKGVSETESFTLGLNTNAQNDVVLTYQVIAKPDTDTAAMLASFNKSQTELSGFYRADNGIFAVSGAYTLSDSSKKSTRKILDAYQTFLDKFLVAMRSFAADSPKPAEGMTKLLDKLDIGVAKLPAVLKKTIDAGNVDVAESFTSDGVLVVAFKIAGGNELIASTNKIFDQMQQLVTQETANASFHSSFTKEKYKDYQLWTVSIPLPEAAKFPSLTYAVGLKEDAIVVAEGISSDTLKILKQSIDESGTLKPLPKETTLFVPAKIGDLVKKYEFDKGINDNEIAAEALRILFEIPQDAKITISYKVEANTLTQTAVFSGKLWKTVGAYGELIYKTLEKQRGSLNFSAIP